MRPLILAIAILAFAALSPVYGWRRDRIGKRTATAGAKTSATAKAIPLSGCSQSSDAHGLTCDKATDGNADQCSHVDKENGWWTATTGQQARIKQIRIQNRKDCCQERLGDFSITVDGVECARHKSSVDFQVKTFDCNAGGREIKISSNKPYLTLCEVEVFGEYIQPITLSGCSQSSDAHGLTCDKATDGDAGQCSHVGEENGWWTANTGHRAKIKQIRIQNRKDCCKERLGDFSITVDGFECEKHKSNVDFQAKTFDCNADGQVIKISSNKPYLTLCEVEVFGEYMDQLPLTKCKQSSLFSGWCNKALDNDSPMISNGGARCSHLDKDPGWWSANTVKRAHIRQIRIFNREDKLQERLNDFAITVDGVECVRYKSSAAFFHRVFECNAIGQEVKISSNKEYLTLCKVEVYGEYVEAIPLSGCSQSSIHTGLTCDKATDGDADQCAHVDKENGWWTATTGRQARIKQIRIQNRKDCCKERLGDFSITVDGVECVRHKSTVDFLVKTFDCNADGREIKISSNKPYLTLCEVEVFGEYVDKLPLISCKQGSDYKGSSCTKAIDNNSPPEDYDEQHCALGGKESGWWSAKMVAQAHVRKIRIFNRLDGKQERLNDFTISVDGIECAKHKSSVAFIDKLFDCDAVGQEIKILSNLEYLTLCKVDVFGEYVDNTPERYLPLDQSCQSQSAGQNAKVWSLAADSQSDCEMFCTEQVDCKYYSYSSKQCKLSSDQRGMNYRKPENIADQCAEVCINSLRFCVLQQRLDGSVQFNRTWAEYENGFGDSRNFWTGLWWLHQITSKSSNLLFRAEFTDRAGKVLVAEYSGFVVRSSSQQYAMDYKSFLAASATVKGDGLLSGKGRMFSTMDRNNGASDHSCGTSSYGGTGWWFGSCSTGNPGAGQKTAKMSNTSIEGFSWYGFASSGEPLKAIRMLIQKPK